MIVLDYSAARPDPRAIARVASGVVRYIGDGSMARTYNLTVAERDALHTAGVPVALVWEREADRMYGGPLAGARDVQVAEQQADALGWPLNRPIFYANDQRNGDDPRCHAYMDAVRQLARRPVGAYGSGSFLRSESIPFKWAVGTWPGMPLPEACLVQDPNTAAPISGTDVNTAVGDWGGWLPGAPPHPPVRSSGPTGADLLAAAYGFHYLPYSTAPGRTQPEVPWADCSGLIVKAWTVLRRRFPSLPEMTANVSTTIESWAVHNGGRYIARAEALTTPACCLAVYGVGSKGHITFGVGDSLREFGTPSDEGHCVGFSVFSATRQRNRYDRFFTLPGIAHHAQRYDEEDDMLIIYTTKPDGGAVQYLAGVHNTKRPIRFSSGADLMTFVGEEGAPIRYLNLSPAEFDEYFGFTPA